MRLTVAIAAAACTLAAHAQSYSSYSYFYFYPGNLYPGARSLFPYLNLFLEQSPPTVTLTAADGRRFVLQRLETFPPDDELNQGTVRFPSYLIPRDLPPGPVTLDDNPFRRFLVGGPPYDKIFTSREIEPSSVAYAHQQTGSGPLRRNRLTDPARPGDRVTLWATGLDRAKVALRETPIEALVTHQSDGLDRIEFTLPENSPADCSFPVSVNAQTVTIATADLGSATCAHRLGVSTADLYRLDRGQKIPAASFRFTPELIEVVYGSFGIADVPLPALPQRSFQKGCNVETVQRGAAWGIGSANSIGFPRPVYSAELIAPNGTRYPTKSFTYGVFHFSGNAIWQPGNWTFRLLSPAPASEITVTARAPFRWTVEPDFANFSLNRDFLLQWDPSQGNASEGVSFIHSQTSQQPVNGVFGHQIICSQPMTEGKLVVPSALLRSVQWLPSATSVQVRAPPYFQPITHRAPDGRYVHISY